MAADRKRVSIHRSKGMKGRGGAAKLFVPGAPGAKKRRRK